eukprot:CAMPEP_0182817778 /NCGR_PEP_ID=MMETSP0006_2-20121128/11657_1 /TAXON_ID=97485 /ORGANISM="Prymnesium parvum, Strain Texoma1" /LENGTH=132 /DNA_ID=CAMNT_0024944169 /DNA_START=388 /DNA_END=788 /DNA_ORIENTATION=+
MPLSSGPSSAHPNILWRASATDDIPLLRERTDAAVARECPWKAGGVKLMELVMASRGRDGPTRTGAEVEEGYATAIEQVDPTVCGMERAEECAQSLEEWFEAAEMGTGAEGVEGRAAQGTAADMLQLAREEA